MNTYYFFFIKNTYYKWIEKVVNLVMFSYASRKPKSKEVKLASSHHRNEELSSTTDILAALTISHSRFR